MHTEKNTGCSMVAWAFLLLTNSNGGLNVGHKKQRLQLYEPIIKKSFHSIEKKLDNLPIGKVSGLGVLQKNQLIRNNSPNFSEYSSMESGYHLLSCWKSGSRYRVPYPSSIYVTVKEIITTELLENQLQEKLICKVPSEQPTLSMINLSEPGLPENINVVSDNEEHIVSNVDTEIDEVTELQDFWIRKSNQPRHIPNMLAGYGITTSMKLNDSNLSKDMKSNQSHYPLTKSYGAQCLTFSPDGKWLAVGVIRHFILNSTTGICAVHRTNKMDCSILIYKYPLNNKRSQPNLELAGHSDIIYSLDWAKTPILQTSNNKSDQKSPRRSSIGTKVFWILASGSADGTVRVWRLHLNRIYKKAINDYNPISLSDGNVVVSRSSTLSQVKVGQIINGLSHKKGVLCNVLGHPNFVYSVVFKPERTEFDRQESQNIQNFFVQTHLLATGCYDRTIRLWSIKHSQAQLLQELNGIHQSHINSLTFDKDGSHIYSGDASGLVAVWQKSNHQRNQVKSQSKWMFEKKIEVRELEMCVINHLEIHPTLNLLLVHQRDNCLKMLDLRSDFITTRFHGALNNTELLRSCISPCGSLLFSGSEDGNVYVWNVNTGDQVEIYQNLLLPGSVTSISYHPMDNVVAFSAVGPESPVAIYKYDIKAGQLSASHLQSKREISHSQGGEINYTEQPPDILTSHVKFKKGNAERILLAVSKLESVLNVSKPQIHNPGYQNDLHELEWRPTYTVIDETSNQRGTVNKLDSRTSSTSQMQAIKGNENMFIALYDYEAQRSDELHLKRGDVVKVLYKDSPKWWMAKSIRTGQQGFILASYVSRNYLGEENDRGRQTISENTRNLSSSLETIQTLSHKLPVEQYTNLMH
ncbi:unnamed protein product [Heterobilharzia americana]|nr:unnamed protein product [Heterobilharzia americana]